MRIFDLLESVFTKHALGARASTGPATARAAVWHRVRTERNSVPERCYAESANHCGGMSEYRIYFVSRSRGVVAIPFEVGNELPLSGDMFGPSTVLSAS